MKWEFFVPCRLPSQNVRDRQHWAVKKNQLDRLTIVVHGGKLKVKGQRGVTVDTPDLIPADAIIHPPYEKRKLSLFVVRQKQLDTDNLYGSVKPLIDTLKERRKKGEVVRKGVVYDDSPDWCELRVTQESLSKLKDTELADKEGVYVTVEGTSL